MESGAAEGAPLAFSSSAIVPSNGEDARHRLHFRAALQPAHDIGVKQSSPSPLPTTVRENPCYTS